MKVNISRGIYATFASPMMLLLLLNTKFIIAFEKKKINLVNFLNFNN